MGDCRTAFPKKARARERAPAPSAAREVAWPCGRLTEEKSQNDPRELLEEPIVICATHFLYRRFITIYIKLPCYGFIFDRYLMGLRLGRSEAGCSKTLRAKR